MQRDNIIRILDTVLVTLLLAPDIDFLPKVFVLSLKIVKNNVGLVKLVFKHLDLVLVLSHFSSGGPDGLESFSLVTQFLTGLLVLVFKHH